MDLPRPTELRRVLAARTPAVVKGLARPVARRFGLAAPPGEWWRAATPPWQAPTAAERRATRWCNVCRWSGPAFLGVIDGESADCPRCGSIARDRFLFWCFVNRTPQPAGRRVLETSPRLGDPYRSLMRRWFDYRCSDFDQRSHRADLEIDLQDIALPSESVDVLLAAHVLEHVPDTARALAEMHRILAPGGRLYLQVPLVYGATAPPVVPEFHADDTPVFFNFGWDLTDAVRAAGFDVTMLVPRVYHEMLSGRRPFPPSPAEGFHVDQLAAAVRIADLTPVLADDEARRLGIEPAYHFSTWEAIRRDVP
jgi:hypothetical protein